MPQPEWNAILEGLLKDPFGFLSTNIVYINMRDEKLPTTDTRTFDATVEGKAVGSGRYRGGGAVYDVHEGAVGTAYYLPWDYNTGYFIILNSKSPVRLMFTAALSGCAVGVVWADDGSARVSHHNIESSMGGTDEEAQRTSLMFTQAALHRNQYRREGEDLLRNIYFQGFAHVHGVQAGDGSWHFYVQILRRETNLSTAQTTFIISDVGELRP